MIHGISKKCAPRRARRLATSGLILAAAFATAMPRAEAQQFDAPYYELQEKHQTRWAEEDRAVDEKLAEG